MPRSEEANRALATISSSSSSPIAANAGAAWLALTVGLELCATTHIEQAADSVRVG